MTETATLSLGDALAQHETAEAAKRIRHGDVAARNRAGSIGWPCASGDRFLVLQRTEPGIDFSPELQMIVEEGTAQEEPIAEGLRQDGWEVWKPETVDLVWPKFQISGRIDRLCRIPEKVALAHGRDPAQVYVLELKTMSPFAWQRIHSWRDLQNAKYPYHRCYPAQLSSYLWLEERPAGILVLKNKANSQKTYLRMDMDEWVWLAEECLQRAARVNAHLAAGTVPPVTGWDADVCPNCSRRLVCMPGEQPIGADVILSAEMQDDLARREELIAPHKEYEALDSSIKAATKKIAGEGGSGIWICGDYTLQVKSRNQHYKALPERDLVVTTVAIRRAKGQSDDGADGSEGA